MCETESQQVREQMKVFKRVLDYELPQLVTIKELNPSTAHFNSFNHEYTNYERFVTPHFSGDSNDILMKLILKKYAFEKRTPIEN